MPEYDWSAKLTTAEIIACTATAAATTATVGYYADFPGMASAAIGTSAAGGQAIYDARAGSTYTAMTVRAASWLLTTGWTTYHNVTHTLPDTRSWIAAACAGILATAANWAVNETEPSRRRERALMTFKRQAAITQDEWAERIERVTHIKGCRVLPTMQLWPKDAGYTLEVALPKGGTTVEHLQRHQKGFASDMNLPEGCGVEIGPSPDGRGIAVFRISTRNMISVEEFYPADWSPLDATELWPFGYHRDATLAEATLLDDCGIVIGDTGSGKTNLLKSMIMTFVRMPAKLIWAADTTGSGVAIDFITPWAIRNAEGRQAARPGVDWLAPTIAEVRVMLLLAIQIIAVRKTRYQALMRRVGDDKIPVSADVPEIIIVMDEVAELPTDVKNLMETVMNTGRACRVRLLFSALRATTDTITVAMKKRARLRIGMHTEDPEELAYLFPGYVQVDSADAPVPGSGWYYWGGRKGLRTFKSHRINGEIITTGCIACAARRPELDKISHSAKLIENYRTRWLRTLPQLFPAAAGGTPAEEELTEGEIEEFTEEVENMLRQAAEAGIDTRLTTERDKKDSDKGDGDEEDEEIKGVMKEAVGAKRDAPMTLDQLNAMFAARNQQLLEEDKAIGGGEYEGERGPEPDQEEGEDPDQDGDTGQQQAPEDTPSGAQGEFRRVLKEAGHPVPAAPRDLVPKVKSATLTPEKQAYRLLFAAGPDGTSPTKITEDLESDGVKVPRTTVQGWAKKWLENDDAIRVGSGAHARYVHPQHVNLREP